MTELLIIMMLAFGWLAGIATALMVGYLVERNTRFTDESSIDLVTRLAELIVKQEELKNRGDSQKP